MKVFYRSEIADKIQGAINEALRKQLKIDYIELTVSEWLRFKVYLDNLMFKRYTDNVWATDSFFYSGVEIRKGI